MSELNRDCLSALLLKQCDPKELGSDALAFVGDGVYGLLVREHLAAEINGRSAELSRRSVELVRCETQARCAKALAGYLTVEEEGVFRRGRNYHTAHSPRRLNAEYHAATGLEALFGYTYLKGDTERLRELFEICMIALDDLSEG